MVAYAIQLPDLMVLRRDDSIIGDFIAPLVGNEAVYLSSTRWDDVVVPFVCDEEQAAAIVAVLRTKYGRHQVRCYRKAERGGWKRV